MNSLFFRSRSRFVRLAGFVAGLLASAVFLAQAQYKAPSQYFRKDSPGVRPGGQNPGQAPAGTPGAPAAPGAPGAPSAAAKPAFKDVALNSQFYFLSDTNRAFPWTKLSSTTAKNAKGVTRPIPAETLVQR